MREKKNRLKTKLKSKIYLTVLEFKINVGCLICNKTEYRREIEITKNNNNKYLMLCIKCIYNEYNNQQ